MKNHSVQWLFIFYFVLFPSTEVLAGNSPSLGDESSGGDTNGGHTLTESDGKSNNTKNHILMFHPWGTRSHMEQLKVLVKGLLKSGNAVTGVFVWKTGIEHDDYVELLIEDG